MQVVIIPVGNLILNFLSSERVAIVGKIYAIVLISFFIHYHMYSILWDELEEKERTFHIGNYHCQETFQDEWICKRK